ncbi:MAG: ATPase, T2SS/T4P/T4SS family [Candidatus Omnitrophota bacterium]
MLKDYRIKRLGRILIEKGLLSSEQLNEALENQKTTGRSLGRVLTELGYINEDELLVTLGIQAGMEMVSLDEITIPEEAILKIPASVARFYNIMPISFKNNLLTIATAQPLDINIFDDLKFMLNCNVKGKVAPQEEILRVLKKHYGVELESVHELFEELEEQIKGLEIDEEFLNNVYGIEKAAIQLPVVKLVNLVLLQAIKQQASDIHFEPFEHDFRIRHRVDGVLRNIVNPPKNLSFAITSRMKVMANLDIAETRLPQDGRIFVSIADQLIDLRISTFPTIFGESLVIRVLDKTQVNLSLDEIGLSPQAKDKLLKLISRPYGIILSTGPTGCGKTTTQYSCLKTLNKIEYKIITTEDPVEYDLDGIIQVSVRPKIDLTFAKCLRHILRQDPDIIMIGEIRDTDTAQIAIHASLTGHLVFSTLHTNDAVTAITRLIDMGIEPFLIASSLEAVIAQRLMRTICAQCREEYTPPVLVLKELGILAEEAHSRKFYHGRGCNLCFNSGYRGRIGIFELLSVDRKMRELITNKSPLSELKNAAIENGMKPLRDDAISKVYEGKTTFEEVLRITQSYI